MRGTFIGDQRASLVYDTNAFDPSVRLSTI